MSTRCNIIIESSIHDNDDKILYRHCDGMPSSAGKEIKSELSEYVNNKDSFDYGVIAKRFINNIDFEEEDSIAGDINYLYKITVYPSNIFYSCYYVPVFKKYDIENIDDDPDCELIECQDFNNCNIPMETIEKTNDVIVDSKKLLHYIDERNKFIDKLLEKYNNEVGISKDVYKKALEASYNQGYNYHLIDSI